MNVLEKILEEMENRVNFRKNLVRYEKKKGTITDVARNRGALEELVIVEKIIRSHMDETISEMEKVEKEKVTSAEIISREIDGKPYYEIKFKKVGEDEYTVGYSSFKLDYVVKWLNDYFEFAGEAKVFCENGGWIPVEDGLPDKGTYVMCCFDDGTVDVLWQNWKEDKSLLFYADIDGEIRKAIAWRPLPEPYKPKKDIEDSGARS